MIGEELWRCHRDGITVYDCQWNKLREIRLGRWATSVAALDTKTVVIATARGLVISSTAGMNVRVANVYMFCKLHILKSWHPTYFRDLSVLSFNDHIASTLETLYRTSICRLIFAFRSESNEQRKSLSEIII